jgi:hypothetical protein
LFCLEHTDKTKSLSHCVAFLLFLGQFLSALSASVVKQMFHQRKLLFRERPVNANAKASAAWLEPKGFSILRILWIILWICLFSARPLPVMALLTSVALT